jgi:transcriptional regulator with PAS, ATPase and Fis domain
MIGPYAEFPPNYKQDMSTTNPGLISCLRQSRVILRAHGAVVNDLKNHADLFSICEHREVKDNITLAFRHVEDAIMRLGKAIQALDGGVSVYDDRRIVLEPKKQFCDTAGCDNSDMRRTICDDTIKTESLESRVVNTIAPPTDREIKIFKEFSEREIPASEKQRRRDEEKIQLQHALNNFLRLKAQVTVAALEHRHLIEKLNGTPLTPIDEERGGRSLDALAKAPVTNDNNSTQY